MVVARIASDDGLYAPRLACRTRNRDGDRASWPRLDSLGGGNCGRYDGEVVAPPATAATVAESDDERIGTAAPLSATTLPRVLPRPVPARHTQPATKTASHPPDYDKTSAVKQIRLFPQTVSSPLIAAAATARESLALLSPVQVAAPWSVNPGQIGDFVDHVSADPACRSVDAMSTCSV